MLALLAWSLARPGTAASGPGVNALGSAAPMTSRPAPDFQLQLFTTPGTTWQLRNQRGHLVVINFWASWCAPCRTEVGALTQAAQEYAGAGIRVVGVDLWDERAAAQAFLAEFGGAYPNGQDAGGAVGVDYGVTGIPETFVVDAQGQLRRRWIGPVSRSVLDNLVGREAGQ